MKQAVWVSALLLSGLALQPVVAATDNDAMMAQLKAMQAQMERMNPRDAKPQG
jgi:hypothetical protein